MKKQERKLALFIFMLMFVVAASAQITYRTQLNQWRAEREAGLKASDGWLSVIGLFWLNEGMNTVGADKGNDVVLPENSAPAQVGAFELNKDKVNFRAADKAEVTLNGQTVSATEVSADKATDVLRLGDLSLLLIKRSGRYGLRLKDANARQRREFTGLRWYPAQEHYRITAEFFAHPEPKEINIVNVLGDVQAMKSPGLLVFRLNGQEYRLEPVQEADGKLFIIFRDLTSGKTTYPAGRFLYADAPVNGKVELDFNKAINPPCAFTAFATCPLPPKQNYLKVAIEAGEQNYHANDLAARNSAPLQK